MSQLERCARCNHREFLGETGLCEDCTELIQLREKVKEAEAAIDETIKRSRATHGAWYASIPCNDYRVKFPRKEE